MRERFTAVDVFIYLLLALLGASILFAFQHLLSLSLSPSWVATKGGIHLIPVELTLDNYRKVLESQYIWQGYQNTLIRTVAGPPAAVCYCAGRDAVQKFCPHRPSGPSPITRHVLPAA